MIYGEMSPVKYRVMFAAMRKCKNIAGRIVIPGAANSMNCDNPAAFSATGARGHDDCLEVP